jgi:hypothetical protein
MSFDHACNGFCAVRIEKVSWFVLLLDFQYLSKSFGKDNKNEKLKGEERNTGFLSEGKKRHTIQKL